MGRENWKLIRTCQYVDGLDVMNSKKAFNTTKKQRSMKLKIKDRNL